MREWKALVRGGVIYEVGRPSYGQRQEFVKHTSPRGLPYHWADKAGNIYSAPLCICRLLLSCCGSVAAPRAKTLAQRSIPAIHNERHSGQWPGHHDQVPVRRRGHRPGRHGQVLAARNKAMAWASRSSNSDSQRAPPRGTAWAHRQHDLVPARLHHDQLPATHTEATAWASRSSTCDAQRAAPRATA
jgi:hypothetical protein